MHQRKHFKQLTVSTLPQREYQFIMNSGSDYNDILTESFDLIITVLINSLKSNNDIPFIFI